MQILVSTIRSQVFNRKNANHCSVKLLGDYIFLEKEEKYMKIYIRCSHV